MKRLEVKANYQYVEFDLDVDMYNYLYDKLKEGYKITDSFNLCVEINKNDNYELLSRFDIEHIDINIKDKIKSLYEKKEIEYPDYNDTLLGVISGIKNNFDEPYRYPIIDGIFDKKYKKVVIMLLDGMGTNILMNNLDDDSFLKTHYVKSIHSIYPSTTAAATTSVKSGLSPITSGWTGWCNYLKEADRVLVLFNGKDYYTGNPTGISLYKYIPYDMFYKDFNIPGASIEPDFSKDKHHKIKQILKRSLKELKKNDKMVQYVYFPEPDAIMHEKGPYSIEAIETLNELDLAIEAYAKKLPSDTLLIISADHGHTAVKSLNIYDCKLILDLLERKPANDSRCVSFKVIPGKEKEFENMFNTLFGDVYKLFKTTDAINMGFFGLKDDQVNSRIDDFLGDYVALGINKYVFNYQGKDNFDFKSHHAGITKDEMFVPICIVRK